VRNCDRFIPRAFLKKNNISLSKLLNVLENFRWKAIKRIASTKEECPFCEKSLEDVTCSEQERIMHLENCVKRGTFKNQNSNNGIEWLQVHLLIEGYKEFQQVKNQHQKKKNLGKKVQRASKRKRLLKQRFEKM
jgi:hypothetical protein